MDNRELKSRLEQGLDELYAAVKKTTDERTAIAIGKNIKYHQIAYVRLVGYNYIPRRRQNDR